MKQQKKLSLIKETIQNLDKVLEKKEQLKVMGGDDGKQYGPGTTQVPIYC